MRFLEAGVKLLINRRLPFDGSGVAEEYPASHGANQVHPADFAGLEWASAGLGLGLRNRGFKLGQFRGEGGQLGGGDVEPVAVFVESAASA